MPRLLRITVAMSGHKAPPTFRSAAGRMTSQTIVAETAPAAVS
jgi:hypothetical protein